MQRIIFMDDIDEGTEADAGTIRFSLEGQSYEIDLSTKNATKLRSVLAPYTAAARTTGRSNGTKHVKASAPSATTEQLNAIRAWARTQGMQVSDKGRIPADIRLAFDQAHTT
jgi:hypothetical protein